ncbi:hypothetical protein M408DRAFT_204980 [Serendipita vermifera MAFF 305830]|uniref:Uncharacterized protein n=1 Tax=Serendipita vermifera MAFF 305830 TaxID=933852 RepID=A0A0C2X9D6_SERVB|nr:hypothetical protein M408DRAFT_204980 [Serendipita vermifera MAFF 305830]
MMYWIFLVYGTPAEEEPAVDTTQLEGRLIDVELSNEPKIPYTIPVEEVFIQKLSLLLNMPLKTLRSKILKAFKVRPQLKYGFMQDLGRMYAPPVYGVR